MNKGDSSKEKEELTVLDAFFDALTKESIQEKKILTMQSFLKDKDANFKNVYKKKGSLYQMYYERYLIAMKSFLKEKRKTIIRYQNKRSYSLVKGYIGPSFVSHSSLAVFKNRYRLVNVPRKSSLLSSCLRNMLSLTRNDVAEFLQINEKNFASFEHGIQGLRNQRYLKLLSFYYSKSCHQAYLLKYYDLFLEALLREDRIKRIPEEVVKAFRYYPAYLERMEELSFSKNFDWTLVFDFCEEILQQKEDENLRAFQGKVFGYLREMKFSVSSSLVLARIFSNVSRSKFPKIYLEKERAIYSFTKEEIEEVLTFLSSLQNSRYVCMTRFCLQRIFRLSEEEVSIRNANYSRNKIS